MPARHISAPISVEENGRLTVRPLPSNSPAYEQRLNSGDQIVAIDGYRASQSFLQSYLSEKKPGDNVRLSVFRFDKLRDIDITLGENTRPDFAFVAVKSPSEEQKRLYQGYLNAPLK